MHDTQVQVEVDAATSTQWSQWLDEFEDANIFQTRAYGEIRWGKANLSHLVLRRGGEVIALAQLRIIRPTRLPNLGIAYLRWGPLWHRRGTAVDPAVVKAAARALHDEYVKKRRLFLRVLPNALVDTERGRLFESAFHGFERESAHQSRTIMLDLAPPLEEIRKRLDQKWRNQLNRAEKNALHVREGDGPADFRAMIGVFEQMWARKQFKQTSDIHEFARMQEELPPNQKMKVLICEQNGIPVAGAVGTAFGNLGIYLFGATTDAGMSSKGSYLLQWKMVQWLKEKGFRYYDLNGINPESNPGVYHFKKGFSGADVFYMGGLAACENAWSRLLSRTGDLVHTRFGSVFTKLLRGAKGSAN
jgi:lipid II:glycine glycyltransferase (peptidoglycan interpeptide bridge formation enzyme)